MEYTFTLAYFTDHYSARDYINNYRGLPPTCISRIVVCGPETTVSASIARRIVPRLTLVVPKLPTSVKIYNKYVSIVLYGDTLHTVVNLISAQI